LASACRSFSLWLVVGFDEIRSEPSLPIQRYEVSGRS
jgi:hypothetical protein